MNRHDLAFKFYLDRTNTTSNWQYQTIKVCRKGKSGTSLVERRRIKDVLVKTFDLTHRKALLWQRHAKFGVDLFNYLTDSIYIYGTELDYRIYHRRYHRCLRSICSSTDPWSQLNFANNLNQATWRIVFKIKSFKPKSDKMKSCLAYKKEKKATTPLIMFQARINFKKKMKLESSMSTPAKTSLF